MPIFIDSSEARVLIAQGENTLEARNQANLAEQSAALAGQEHTAAQAWAQASNDASALARDSADTAQGQAASAQAAASAAQASVNVAQDARTAAQASANAALGSANAAQDQAASAATSAGIAGGAAVAASTSRTGADGAATAAISAAASAQSAAGAAQGSANSAEGFGLALNLSSTGLGAAYTTIAAGAAATANGAVYMVVQSDGRVLLCRNNSGTGTIAAEYVTQNSILKTVDALLRDTTMARGAGTLWTAGGFVYQELAAGTATYDVANAAGVLFNVVNTGNVTDRAFFAATNIDDTVSLQKYFNWCAAHKQPVRLVQSLYRITDTIKSSVRQIDGGSAYKDSSNPGTNITFTPTVLTDLKPAIEIVGGMSGGGIVRGVKISGNQAYSMMDAATWCPSPANLPAYSAFASGPAGFKISGANQVIFEHCSTQNLKVGRLDYSTNGHIYSMYSDWHGWLAGVYCKLNSEDYQFIGGSVMGIFAGYLFGNILQANHYGGLAASMQDVHMGFSAYAFYQVNDGGISTSTAVSGLYGRINVRFEQIGECAICQLPNAVQQGLVVTSWGLSWSTVYTSWETAASSGWAYNLHPSIMPYASQQKYALRLGNLTETNDFGCGTELPSAILRKSPNNASSRIAYIATWSASLNAASDFSALKNDMDVGIWSSGTRRTNARSGDVLRRADLQVPTTGLLLPNMIKSPEVIGNWTPLASATLSMTDLATYGGAVPRQLYDELGNNPAVLSIPGGTDGYGGSISQFSGYLAPQPNRSIGFSVWVKAVRFRMRLTLYPTAGGYVQYYDTTYLPNSDGWIKYQVIGRSFADQFGQLQIWTVANGGVASPVGVAGPMVFLDDVKPYNNSPAPRIVGPIPTTSAGLPTGSIWSNAGVLTVV